MANTIYSLNAPTYFRVEEHLLSYTCTLYKMYVRKNTCSLFQARSQLHIHLQAANMEVETKVSQRKIKRKTISGKKADNHEKWNLFSEIFTWLHVSSFREWTQQHTRTHVLNGLPVCPRSTIQIYVRTYSRTHAHMHIEGLLQLLTSTCVIC